MLHLLIEDLGHSILLSCVKQENSFINLGPGV